MIEKEMAHHTRNLSDSLRFIFEGFRQQTIDDQREFLEFFDRIIKLTKDKLRKRMLMKFRRELEKEMTKKFDAWLKAEMK